MAMLKINNIITSTVEELEEFIDRDYGPTRIRPMEPGSAFGVRVATSRLDDVFLAWNLSVGSILVEPRVERDVVFFKFCSEGGVRFRVNGREFDNQAGTALSFRSFSSLEIPDSVRHHTVVVSKRFLQERFSALIDRPARYDLAFSEEVLEIEGRIATLSAFLAQWRYSPLLQLSPSTLGRSDSMANMIADAVLLLYPHNMTDQLQQRQLTIAPRHVKRAMDYIHAHPSRHISPSELSGLSGVSVRSLQYAFHTATGQTISHYQRDLRLAKAREEVLSHNDLPLGAIAFKWGFGSPSRFTQLFKESYGQTPSEARATKNQ
jgi:AraC-like DNA-binding protein